MRPAVLGLVAAVAMSAACGGSGDPGLRDALPSMVPSEEQAADFLGISSDVWEVKEVVGEYVSNELAAERGQGPVGTETAAELEEMGRVTGYLSSHSVELGRRGWSLMVYLDLYRDDESASAAMKQMPHWYDYDPFPLDGWGDEAIAMPAQGGVRPDGSRGTCYGGCPFRFRVGPVVGHVSEGHALPVPTFDQQTEEAVARWVIERIEDELSARGEA